jgi:hypothetical protein
MVCRSAKKKVPKVETGTKKKEEKKATTDKEGK